MKQKIKQLESFAIHICVCVCMYNLQNTKRKNFLIGI